jgi:hypothetical protein
MLARDGNVRFVAASTRDTDERERRLLGDFRCRILRRTPDPLIRRECLDRTLFWTATDLEVKLLDFQRYFNGHRAHAGPGGLTPEPSTGEDSARASVSVYRWRPHCRGLYQTPIAA